MGKKLILTMFCIVFAACGSYKRNTHSEYENAIHAKIDTSTAMSRTDMVDKTCSWEFLELLNRNTDLRIVVYDTSAPIEQDGKHPVLAEVTMNVDEVGSTSQKLIDSISTKSVITEDTETKSTIETKTKESKSKDISTGYNFLPLILLVAFALFMFIYNKFFRR